MKKRKSIWVKLRENEFIEVTFSIAKVEDSEVMRRVPKVLEFFKALVDIQDGEFLEKKPKILKGEKRKRRS